MKTIKLTIIAILFFVLGAFATNLYATNAKLIMVPEYIGTYKTIDLLQYMANLKAKDEKPSEAPAPHKEEHKPTDRYKNNTGQVNRADA